MGMVRLVGIIALIALLGACSTVESRIAAHKAAFDASPPDIQAKIREGKADVGFTREQAAMALGRPDHVYTRKTSGTEREVWVYGEAEGVAHFGFAYGMGMGSTFNTVGIAAEPTPVYGARLRVTLEGDKVVAVENRK